MHQLLINFIVTVFDLCLQLILFFKYRQWLICLLLTLVINYNFSSDNSKTQFMSAADNYYNNCIFISIQVAICDKQTLFICLQIVASSWFVSAADITNTIYNISLQSDKQWYIYMCLPLTSDIIYLSSDSGTILICVCSWHYCDISIQVAISDKQAWFICLQIVAPSW